MQLYYLTGSQFALSNLAMRRLKISRFSDLNDPFELMAVDLSNDDERRAMQGFHDHMDSTKGVICFSSKWDNPVLWGHYADKHRGIALGFEVAENLLFPACYENSRFFLPRDPITRLAKPDQATIQRILSTKFTDWQYECEWRFFVELSEAKLEGGLYFEDFSGSIKLNEVILGAKCELPKEKLQDLIDDLGLSANIIKAKIASNEFKVVVDDGL
jgi:hypothetical protein